MISIVEIFREISKRTSENVGYKINYLFGDWSQIAKGMDILSKHRITEKEKYPLLALFTPIIEEKTDYRYYCTASLSMMIATRTLSDYTNEQRLDISYKKLLYPVYEALLKEIKNEKRFDFGSMQLVKHTYSDNMRYGSRGVYGADGKKPFADLFDGIDISDLEIKVKKEQNCR